MVNTMYDIYKTQYLHHAVKYGADTAIFYQVGKFYEMYDWIDAQTQQTHTSMCRAVEILGIQLSPKKGDGPGGTDAFFAGIPEQSLHKYATLLTALAFYRTRSYQITQNSIFRMYGSRKFRETKQNLEKF